jgi:hypothetical protein
MPSLNALSNVFACWTMDYFSVMRPQANSSIYEVI